MTDIVESPVYSVEDLAYTAGFFDGEGCIFIAKIHPHKEKNRYITPSFELQVKIGNTNKSILDWLKNKFGGSVKNRSHQKSLSGKGWTPIYEWNTGNNIALQFLKLVHPYLKIKQQQCALAIEFQTYKRDHSCLQIKHRTQEVLDRKEEYRQAINSLSNSKKQWTPIDSAMSRPSKNVITPSPLNTITLSYTAGLFDAEGCVRISVSRPTEKHGRNHLRHPSHCLRVKLSNTNQGIVEWLHATFLGSIQNYSPKAANADHVWEWFLSTNTAQQFLELICPYLKEKQQQAQIAIEFQTYNREHSRRIVINQTQEVVERKEEYRQQLNGMHTRKIIKGVQEYLSA